MRRGDGHRLLRWLWTSRRVDARVARAALLPGSGLWQCALWAREAAARRGWITVQELGLPTISVGNLSVGGSGRGAVVQWMARHYVTRGLVPGVLLRGPARSAIAHALAHACPEAVVVADDDRVAGAATARAAGANVLILDDGFQRRDLWRDFNLALISAESSRAVRWPLPAGPWREGWRALDRADAVIVTRKRASEAAALAVAQEVGRRIPGPVGVLHLRLFRLERMVSGTLVEALALAGSRVIAASGIADPDAFVAQVKATGAQVQVSTWRDQVEFRDEDVAWLARAARKADYLVVTEQDAVKLRHRWPASVPEPLVAALHPVWDEGEPEIILGLDAATASR